jgi:UDP-glucose 4-epimerase
MADKARIVITGVAGFIGSNLAAYLHSRDYEVAGIDNLSQGVLEQIPENVAFYQLDIRDEAIAKVFRNGDMVFHLAAKNCISDCHANPVETASVNVTGTVNVFEAARKTGVAKIIYAESSAVYEGSELLPTPESENRPLSFYALSKWTGAAFAEAYHRHYGIRSTALRYFCVYGPNQDYRRTIPPVMCAFVVALMRGERPVIYGSGKKRRDFIHVDDVNAFHELCLHDKRTDGGVFNLGTGTNHSINEIYRTIARLLGSEATPIHLRDLPAEAQATLADISRARSLGWQPAIDLDTGLKTFVEHFRDPGLPEFKHSQI